MKTETRKRREPEQTRIARCAKQLARRSSFSTEDIRSNLRNVVPGTLSSTVAKLRDLGYIKRCTDRAGNPKWKGLQPLREDSLTEIVKAINKYSSLLSVMYRFRINGTHLSKKGKEVARREKTATLLKMLDQERERAKTRQRTLTTVYNAIARLQ